MKSIELSNHSPALVDDDDFTRLSRHTWWASEMTNERSDKSQWSVETQIDGKTVKMHRFITNAPEDMDVDHKNGNQFDNQKDNLRVCTRSQNLANASKYVRRKGSSSKFKGVSWYSKPKKWAASLQCNGERIWLGLFELEVDAARTYNEAARKYFGEFAKVNNV